MTKYVILQNFLNFIPFKWKKKYNEQKNGLFYIYFFINKEQ